MQKLLELLRPIFDDQRSFLILLGAVIVVIALAGGVSPYFSVPTGTPQIGLVIFGLILAVVGIYLVLRDGTSRPYGVEILTPENGFLVSPTISVKGTVRRIPAGKELWLVRIWSDEHYYPQKKVFLAEGKKTWSETIDFDNAGQLGAFVIGEEGLALIKYHRAASDRHKSLFADYEKVTKSSHLPTDETNRYLPAFERSSVKALNITECHVVQAASKTQRA